jgi:phosphoribosylanthranilate isomerase
MHVAIKICGIRDERAIFASAEAGADALGFVFAESPRRVTVARAGALLAAVPDGILRVAVFQTPDAPLLREVLALPIDAVQADTEWCAHATLPPGIGCVPAVSDGEELEMRVAHAAQFARGSNRVVLVDGPRGGGRGVPADWPRVAAAARNHRIALAGGLDPNNVGDAIAIVRPFAVDVSSGVESEPGVKSPEAIHRFVDAVRRTSLSLSASGENAAQTRQRRGSPDRPPHGESS